MLTISAGRQQCVSIANPGLFHCDTCSLARQRKQRRIPAVSALVAACVKTGRAHAFKRRQQRQNSRWRNVTLLFYYENRKQLLFLVQSSLTATCNTANGAFGSATSAEQFDLEHLQPQHQGNPLRDSQAPLTWGVCAWERIRVCVLRFWYYIDTDIKA